MPTRNPRINVTISPSLDGLVSRMAVHQRLSKSQVLRELLEAAEPALQRAAALMDAASAAHSELKQRLGKSLEEAQAKAEEQVAEQLGAMDKAVGDLVSMAQTIKGRRPQKGDQPFPASYPSGSVSEPKDPPPSNRGVKSQKLVKKSRAEA
jgi:hypothetical protein